MIRPSKVIAANELLHRPPGMMPAARTMYARTGEERFAELWRAWDATAHGTLMTAGGDPVWKAGPAAGNAGLCHGMSGNGFAFLALRERTEDERRLERARALATHSPDQVGRRPAVAPTGFSPAISERPRSRQPA